MKQKVSLLCVVFILLVMSGCSNNKSSDTINSSSNVSSSVKKEKSSETIESLSTSKTTSTESNELSSTEESSVVSESPEVSQSTVEADPSSQIAENEVSQDESQVNDWIPEDGTEPNWAEIYSDPNLTGEDYRNIGRAKGEYYRNKYGNR